MTDLQAQIEAAGRAIATIVCLVILVGFGIMVIGAWWRP